MGGALRRRVPAAGQFATELRRVARIVQTMTRVKYLPQLAHTHDVCGAQQHGQKFAHVWNVFSRPPDQERDAECSSKLTRQ